MQNYLCADCEGVFTPEIWVEVAKKTDIKELEITTKDEPDYNKLMKRRIEILKENNIKLKDITEIISGLKPVDGALEFLNWAGDIGLQIGIVSDTFTQFAGPIMKQLGYPALFCNELIINDEGFISDYKLRQPDQKKEVVMAMKKLNYKVIAFGDSYNDIEMLKEAENGILYRPPKNVMDEFPQFPVAQSYEELKEKILELI